MSEAEKGFFALVIGMLSALVLAFGFGAIDARDTWTESDMRGEYQLRHAEYSKRVDEAVTEWERLKAEAKLIELEQITVPYGD